MMAYSAKVFTGFVFFPSNLLEQLTLVLAFPSVMALTKASASGVAERMLSTLPCWKRRMEALS